MTKLTYDNLQPWVDMLCDAIENKGASSSGIPNPKVFPYAEKYREILKQVRNKELSKYHLQTILRQYEREIEEVTNQPHRTKDLTEALHCYILKEFMK